jgi:hypothetical protein
VCFREGVGGREKQMCVSELSLKGNLDVCSYVHKHRHRGGQVPPRLVARALHAPAIKVRAPLPPGIPVRLVPGQWPNLSWAPAVPGRTKESKESKEKKEKKAGPPPPGPESEV